MWKEVRGASVSLLSSLGMSVEVCILPFEDPSCVFAFITLLFVCTLVHLIFDVFPQYIALRKLLQDVVSVFKA
jgi:hypothetical protein